MKVFHLRKSTMGSGGSATRRGSKIMKASHFSTKKGSGMDTGKPYAESLGNKPTSILTNLQLKKTRLPKKYITFS
jgi:hypothetical protein|tara:strand:+ start:131 stop:355 length:225 start_codon:yes stop_codon:yes gene_type:complete